MSKIKKMTRKLTVIGLFLTLAMLLSLSMSVLPLRVLANGGASVAVESTGSPEAFAQENEVAESGGYEFVVTSANADITASFKDPAFLAAVREEIRKPSGPILASDVSGITRTRLDVSGRGITSLAGIEHFTSLSTLDVSNNQLSTLDLRNNPALTSLNASANQLTSLDVSRNTALVELHVVDNQLTSLDVRSNAELWSLFVNSNQLVSLDVSRNTLLSMLSVVDNQLTSLDVGRNTALNELWAGANRLTSLDVSNNRELSHLDVRWNNILSVDRIIGIGNTRLPEVDTTGVDSGSPYFMFSPQMPQVGETPAGGWQPPVPQAELFPDSRNHPWAQKYIGWVVPG